MKAFTIASLASAAAAVPFSYPLKNGFPNPNATAIAKIEKQAGGTLPNSPLPTNLTPPVITSLQLVAANELFEVAYFTQLHHNITTKVSGYECTQEDHKFVAGAIKRIQAQEELHALGANAILKANNATTIGPCKYQFPVTDFQSAIKLANTFTDVVLGVLPMVQLQGGTQGGPQGPNLIPLSGSIEEQEAQQASWFRILQSKYPSAAPFLTSATPQFALSALQMFLVPRSCPPEYDLITSAIKSFPALTVTDPPTARKQSASFSIEGTLNNDTNSTSDISVGVAYLSEQNLPLIVPITNIQQDNHKNTTTFDALFPAEEKGFADGLTIAAVVSLNGNETLMDAAQVVERTLFGPGLIEYR